MTEKERSICEQLDWRVYEYEEGDIDLFNTPCRITDFEGSWMRVIADTKKGKIEKLIPASSVLSIEIVKEAD